jgi:hypothetical protein
MCAARYSSRGEAAVKPMRELVRRRAYFVPLRGRCQGHLWASEAWHSSDNINGSLDPRVSGTLGSLLLMPPRTGTDLDQLLCVERFLRVHLVGKAREGILVPLEISSTFASSKREVNWLGVGYVMASRLMVVVCLLDM